MKQCYLCGTTLIKNVNKSKDHIPPDCFFPPCTPNMITVPCCKSCNEEYAPLDHKMRNYLVTLSPMLFETIEKGRHYILKSPKLVKDYLSYTKPHPTLLYPSGKPTLVFYFNDKELKKFLSRITKGLFYHQNHQRLSDKAIISAKALPEIKPQPSNTFLFEKGLERRPYFVYGIVPDEKNPNKNYCIMIFFDQFVFIVAFGTSGIDIL